MPIRSTIERATDGLCSPARRRHATAWSGSSTPRRPTRCSPGAGRSKRAAPKPCSTRSSSSDRGAGIGSALIQHVLVDGRRRGLARSLPRDRDGTTSGCDEFYRATRIPHRCLDLDGPRVRRPVVTDRRRLALTLAAAALLAATACGSDGRDCGSEPRSSTSEAISGLDRCACAPRDADRAPNSAPAP
jgi:hypothetical protein